MPTNHEGENFSILDDTEKTTGQNPPVNSGSSGPGKLRRLTEEEQKKIIDSGRPGTDWTTRTHRRLLANPDVAWLGITILLSFLCGFAFCFLLLAALMWLFQISPANMVAFFVAVGTAIVTAWGAKFAAAVKLATEPGTIAKALQTKANKNPALYDEKGFTIPQIKSE